MNPNCKELHDLFVKDPLIQTGIQSLEELESIKAWRKIEEHNAFPIYEMSSEEFEKYVDDHVALMEEYNAALKREMVY